MIVLDEVALRQELRQALISSQPLDPGQVQALGPARAQAIRQSLVEQAQVDGKRVSVAPETAALDDSGSWVACRLAIEPE